MSVVDPTKIDLSSQTPTVIRSILSVLRGLYTFTSGNNYITLGSGLIPAALSGSRVSNAIYAGDGRLHLVADSTVASGGEDSINFTGGFSGADGFYLLVYTLAPETDNVDLWLRMGVSGTYASGASDYEWVYLRRGGGATGTGGNGGDTKMTVSVGVGNASGEHAWGVVLIPYPSSTAHNKAIVGLAGFKSAAGDPYVEIHMGARLTTATAQTDIQILFSSGQIAAGGRARLYSMVA